MSLGTCVRCGAEESMFWYPYAFGMGSTNYDRTQYFTLCDKCHQEFVDFMYKEGKE